MDDRSRLEALARVAADEVRPGMTLGLGTGSTAEAVIQELGRRVADGLPISGVPTSRRSASLAETLGIPLLAIDEVDRLDLGIDGADEIAPSLDVVKGRGGALLHEKLVALLCDDYLIVAASEKLVPRLGTGTPIPVEIVPFGWRQTASRLRMLGYEPTLRRVADPDRAVGPDAPPFLTDGGHVILDCALGPIGDPASLGAATKGTAGVVEHGLFLGIARRAIVAEPDGSIRRLGPSDSSADDQPHRLDQRT
jgi:ribose 5-phosphate isomerase A